MTTLKTSFNIQADERRSDRRFILTLTATLLVGFLATIASYWTTNFVLRRERTKVFNQTAERIQQWVEERMLGHVNTLRGLQAFWVGSTQGVTRDEFSSYINSLNVIYDYPGLSSVAFFERSGDKIITAYIEPVEGREAALGFDHTTVPERKAFLDQVRDSGQILSSQPFTLVTTNRLGFFLTAPLYRGGKVPESLSERRDQLIGFVNMAFRDNQLFEALFGRQNPMPDVDFHIYHGKLEAQPENADQLLYDSDTEIVYRPEAVKPLSKTMQITVGNQPWTIFVNAKLSFTLTKSEENLPRIILNAGLLLCAVASVMIFRFYRRHLKTWHS